jgi:hypothetical protein
MTAYRDKLAPRQNSHSKRDCAISAGVLVSIPISHQSGRVGRLLDCVTLNYEAFSMNRPLFASVNTHFNYDRILFRNDVDRITVLLISVIVDVAAFVISTLRRSVRHGPVSG